MTVTVKTFMARFRRNCIQLILAVVTLASCTADKDALNDRVILQPAIARSLETVIETRATVPVNGTNDTYRDDVLGNGTTIRVYGVPSTFTTQAAFDENKAAGSFRYSNNTWHSSVSAKTSQAYHLYAFSPVTLPGATSQTFNWGIENGTFNLNNVALSITGLDVLTTTDPIANVAVAGKKVAVNQQEDVVAPTLTKGDFSAGLVEFDIDYVYKVWMAMDHLYSKATIWFCVDQDYYDIRDIRIKSARICVQDYHLTGTHTYSFKNGFTPADNANFENIDANGKDQEIDLINGPTAVERPANAPDYISLTTTYSEFAWFCFLPKSYVPDLEYPDAKLKVVYDVYDWKGNLVRPNQEAENSFSLSSFKRADDAVMKPKPGEHFKVKIKVKPSYLHQLIDDDAELKLTIEE